MPKNDAIMNHNLLQTQQRQMMGQIQAPQYNQLPMHMTLGGLPQIVPQTIQTISKSYKLHSTSKTFSNHCQPDKYKLDSRWKKLRYGYLSCKKIKEVEVQKRPKTI